MSINYNVSLFAESTILGLTELNFRFSFVFRDRANLAKEFGVMKGNVERDTNVSLKMDPFTM